MATTFNAKLSIEALFNEIVQSGNQKMGNLQSRFQFIQDLPTGLLDTNINVGYAATSSAIGASTTTSYDLIGGLSSSTGTVINFDEVVLIAVRNRSSTAVNYLSVGPHATNGFWNNAADRSIVPADSWTLWYSKGGVPAAAAATDVLAVITGASASAATWDILILGRDN